MLICPSTCGRTTSLSAISWQLAFTLKVAGSAGQVATVNDSSVTERKLLTRPYHCSPSPKTSLIVTPGSWLTPVKSCQGLSGPEQNQVELNSWFFQWSVLTLLQLKSKIHQIYVLICKWISRISRNFIFLLIFVYPFSNNTVLESYKLHVCFSYMVLSS